MPAIFEPDCTLCGSGDAELLQQIADLRSKGWGSRGIWQATEGVAGRLQIEQHVRHVPRGVATAIGDAVDEGQPVAEDWLARQGIEAPKAGDGVTIVAGTVEVSHDGRRSWLRVRPEVDEIEAERIEIRQAQPVEVVGDRSSFFATQGNWQTWIASPDAQIGYWVDARGGWHTTHDERAFDLGHLIARAVAQSDGLHGWIDPGDFADLAAPSRFNAPPLDTHVEGLNRTWQRCSEEFARRRYAVGPDGELVLLEGNHDLRLKKKAAQEMPYLVGMRRAGDPEDEHPVLSVPYLTRARDYGVEWVPGFSATYRLLNSNLAVFHAPFYGSKALDTARKIAARVHCSVYHGHTHRREALAENIETSRGSRTMEVWSDGTWGRIDGALPSQLNAYDDSLTRMVSGSRPDMVGQLSENMHQGMSVIHVEVGGRERFSVERVAFWDGWAQFRGQVFEATCDQDGAALKTAA